MYIRKLSFEGRKKYKQVSKVKFHVTVNVILPPDLYRNFPDAFRNLSPTMKF